MDRTNFFAAVLEDDNNPPFNYQVDALRSYLEDKAELSETLASLTAWPDNNDWDDAWYRLSGLVYAALETFPEEVPRLLDLIDAIHDLKPQDTRWTDEQRASFADRDKLLFGFQVSMFLSEQLNSTACRLSDWVDGNSDVEAENDGLPVSEAYQRDVHEHLAIERLFAQWFDRKYKRNGDLGGGVYGMSSLKDALEFRRTSPPATLTTAQLCDGEVGAAAEWIIHAGDTIYTLTQTPDAFPRHFPVDGIDADVPRQGSDRNQVTYLYKGAPGLNKERWAFWKRRFTEARQIDGLNPSTVQLIDGAINKMNEIDGGHSRGA